MSFLPHPYNHEKIILFTALSFLTTLSGATACSRNLEQNDPKTASHTAQSDDASATSQKENNMNILDKTSIDERCLHAVENLEWKNIDMDQALKACQMYHTFLIKQYEGYDKMMLIENQSHPIMQAFVEREINPVYVIHAQDGAIPKNDMDSLQAFAKHIDILHSALTAKKLAQMVCCFHARATDFLITEYSEPYGSVAAIHPPEFHINDNGSATLTYALKRDGISVTVTRCTLHIAPDYSVKLDINNNLHICAVCNA